MNLEVAYKSSKGNSFPILKGKQLVDVSNKIGLSLGDNMHDALHIVDNMKHDEIVRSIVFYDTNPEYSLPTNLDVGFKPDDFPL